MNQGQQSQISVGDLVRLNSGSPDLEVIAAGTEVTVQWRNGEEIKQSVIPLPCVHHASDRHS